MLRFNDRLYPETPEDEIAFIAYMTGTKCFRENIGPVMLEGGEMAVPEHEWTADAKFAYLIAEPGVFWHYYLQGWIDAYSADR